MTNVTPSEDPMGVAKTIGLPVAEPSCTCVGEHDGDCAMAGSPVVEDDDQKSPQAEAYRKAAKVYCTDELEMDEGAIVSMAADKDDEGGAWVQAWIWVTAEESGICRECGEVNADNGEGWDGLCGNCADETTSQEEA